MRTACRRSQKHTYGKPGRFFRCLRPRPKFPRCQSSTGAGSVGATKGEGEAAGMTPVSAPIRHALELLASSQHGWTLPFLAAHDVPTELVLNLIREGLAVAKTEGVRPAELTYIKITDKGRVALEGPAA